MSFLPYLFFGGTCREAMTRYHEIFGGELDIMTAADAPQEGDGEGMHAGNPDMVIHAAVTIGDAVLMGSDDPISDPFGPVQGMMVSYTAPGDDEARRVFDALSEGGTVTQDLIPTFFASSFGMCTDRFGTPWMISTDPPEAD